MSSTTITMSPADLEMLLLIRRVVQEEISRVSESLGPSILHDWRHEGPEEPAEDELLAQEALARLRESRENPETVMSLEDFQEELAQAEAAGELPD